MSKNRFSPKVHLPTYSKLIFKTLQNPLVIYIVIAGNFALCACVLLFYQIEHGINPKINTLFDALWWGMATVTTVGYGDIIPVTVFGRIINMILMITGLVSFVGFTAVFVSILLSQAAEDMVKQEKLTIQEYHEVMNAISELSARLKKIEKNLKSKKK